MGFRPQKLCAACIRPAMDGSRYCTQHQGLAQQREAEYRDNALRKLYRTRRWRLTRAQVLHDDPICAHVEGGRRCPWLATNVHHVIRAEIWVARGGDFFDPANLQGLCHAHHSAETAREVGFAGHNKRLAKKHPRHSATSRQRRAISQHNAIAGHFNALFASIKGAARAINHIAQHHHGKVLETKGIQGVWGSVLNFRPRQSPTGSLLHAHDVKFT